MYGSGQPYVYSIRESLRVKNTHARNTKGGGEILPLHISCASSERLRPLTQAVKTALPTLIDLQQMWRGCECVCVCVSVGVCVWV